MKAMTRRSLLTNVTRGHHREAPGATAPSTAVRGENGGERDDGATNVVGDVPERPPVARRMEIGELCAETRRQAQRHRRGPECSACIRALPAPELLSREWGGDAARRDQRIRAVQERCTALHHALRSTMGHRFCAVQWHRHRACQLSPEPRGDRAQYTPQRRTPRGPSTRPCACVVYSSREFPRVNT